MDKGKLHPHVHEIQFCQGNPIGYSSGDQNMLEHKKSNEDPQRNLIFMLSSMVYNLEFFFQIIGLPCMCLLNCLCIDRRIETTNYIYLIEFYINPFT